MADNNTATGASALWTNWSGTKNTATGVNALFSNNTGNSNTAAGMGALFSNSSGSYNTATGINALYHDTARSNTADGANALYANTSGTFNTATGQSSLSHNTSGSNNVADGVQALGANTSGGSNIGIGYQAGLGLTTGSNNIDLGNPGVAGEGATIRIGDNKVQSAAYLAGVSGAALSGGTEVVVSSSGQLGVLASSARFKRDIRTMGAASQALMKLRPVTFVYRNDPRATPQYGLVAEEVRQVYPELVSYDGHGQIVSVRYQQLVSLLLNQVQRQQHELAAIAPRMAQLEEQLAELNAQTQALRDAVQQPRRPAEETVRNGQLSLILNRLRLPGRASVAGQSITLVKTALSGL